MNTLRKVTIIGFWGEKKIVLNLNSDVNIIIGKNGTGKTTILRIIASILDVNIIDLYYLPYSEVRIDFSGPNNWNSVTVEKDQSTNDIKYRIVHNKEEELYVFPFGYVSKGRFGEERTMLPRQSMVVREVMSTLADHSWLSVNRSSLVGMNTKHDQSIDDVIENISNQLKGYFSSLNHKCNIENQRFEKDVFTSLLDTPNSYPKIIETLVAKRGEESQNLKEIFKIFGILDLDTEEKIDNYYISVDKAIDALKKKKKVSIFDYSYILSATRIHSLAKNWQVVSQIQNRITKRKQLFLQIMSSLLTHKQIIINESNELEIVTQDGRHLPISCLSSGEKQLLILLSNALLKDDENSHIYIADEPELSLHIEWQEQLIQSLRIISPNTQLILATHSPDIVGPYQDSIIDLNALIYG